MAFTEDILAWSTRTKENGRQLNRRLARKGLQYALDQSPVLTGRFKGNWRVGVNGMDITFNENLKDKSGSYTYTRGNARISAANWNDRIFISNTTPYGKYLEPNHLIVDRALELLRGSVDREVAIIRRSNFW